MSRAVVERSPSSRGLGSRRRTYRACDHCHASRTRCDGSQPCRRCIEYQNTCEYQRISRKRGRPPNTTSDRQNIGPCSSSSEEPRQLQALVPAVVNELDVADDFNHQNEDASPLSQPVQSNVDASAPEEHRINTASIMQNVDGGESAIHNRPSPSDHGLSLSGGAVSLLESDSTSRCDILDCFRVHQTEPPMLTPQPSSRAFEKRRRYPFLDPALPYIVDVLSEFVAVELLDIFLAEPGVSLFQESSPYVVARILRKKSIAHQTSPRQTSPALIVTILWCVCQTANVTLLRVPRVRSKVINRLYEIATALALQEDPKDNDHLYYSIDLVLTYALITIVISGGDFRADSFRWWSKTIGLALMMGLNREDEVDSTGAFSSSDELPTSGTSECSTELSTLEHREERRRVFWLLFSLDRHFALSWNCPLSLPDYCCKVYVPLPDVLWEFLDSTLTQNLPVRKLGPPMTVSGPNFIDCMLPLTTILGDVIEVHRQREHPRLGKYVHDLVISDIERRLAVYKTSLDQLSYPQCSSLPSDYSGFSPKIIDLAKAYGSYIHHTVHILLHGKWDIIEMMDNDDGWIASDSFGACASHAVAASQCLSNILELDPELMFMPYEFGIYLLHGSSIFLLFADRMPQLGYNDSVEQACEIIIRAHEVAVVTLNTGFQRDFRKVMRSILGSVRNPGLAEPDERNARRKILSLYRWTSIGRGLAV